MTDIGSEEAFLWYAFFRQHLIKRVHMIFVVSFYGWVEFFLTPTSKAAFTPSYTYKTAENNEQHVYKLKPCYHEEHK